MGILFHTVSYFRMTIEGVHILNTYSNESLLYVCNKEVCVQVSETCMKINILFKRTST